MEKGGGRQREVEGDERRWREVEEGEGGGGRCREVGEDRGR